MAWAPDELSLQELARASRLFAALGPAGRMHLLSETRRHLFGEGEVICREGEPGDEFFIVSSGQVRVSCKDGNADRELAVLTPGSFFGEMAALNGDVRSATVVAVGEVELVGFPASVVAELLESHPAAREVLHKVGLLRAEDTLEKLRD